MTRTPTVSVVMPAYNAEEYIGLSIRSILAQSYRDLELVVVDDGSLDRTAEVVARLNDQRIRLIRSSSNLGLAGARNLGLESTRGKYIAWLDADDIARHDRLERQVRVLDRFDAVGICGSWVKTFGTKSGRVWRYPRKSAYVKAQMLFDDPLATSTVTMRASLAHRAGLRFATEHVVAEDYDYWERMSHLGQVINLPRTLVSYRIHPGQTSKRDQSLFEDSVRKIQERQLLRLGLTLSAEEWILHRLVGVEWGVGVNRETLGSTSDWLRRLISANRVKKVFDERAFTAIIEQRRRLLELSIDDSSYRRLVYKLAVLSQ